jgi:hypothetical protein
MNRSFASWIADSPGPAVLVTGLLGLLPLFGLGFASCPAPCRRW